VNRPTSVDPAWPTTCDEAARVQAELAGRVRVVSWPHRPRTLAALDVAFVGPPRASCELVAGAVLWDVASARVVERQSVRAEATFPYVPGFLSFRESPAVLAALAKLRGRPDLLLVDGQGLAHPRAFGLACHLGVLTALPAIGCAKSLLVGEPAGRLAEDRGAAVSLLYAGRVVGAMVRTRTSVKPVYVSVGHRVTLAQAVGLVLALAARYRLPEPARAAHNYVTELARSGWRRRPTTDP